MSTGKSVDLVKRILSIVALLAASPSLAQENNALGNLFGALVQAGAKSKAQKAWAQVSPQTTQCVNTMFSAKNVTVDQLIEAGLAPNDKRLAPVINACNAFLTAQLRTNFPCTVTNANAQQVATTCNESFAKEVDGSLVPISGDEVILAAANGEKIAAGNFETEQAQQARLAEEQRQAAAERARFLASPEGKRQAAAEAARARQAEAARLQQAAQKRAEAANIARRWPYIAEFYCRLRGGGGESNMAACLSYEGQNTHVLVNNGESVIRYGINERNWTDLVSPSVLRLGRNYTIIGSSANEYLYIEVLVKDRMGIVVKRIVL